MHKLARLLGLSLVLAWACTTAQAAVTVDFEGLADGTVVGTLSGVSFQSLEILSAGLSLNEFEAPPHSGSNVGINVDSVVDIVLPAGVTSVGGYLTYGESVLVEFFGSGGLLGSYASLFTSNMALSGDPNSSPNEFFSFNSATSLTLVKISAGLAGSFVLDDFSFEAGTQPPPPPPGTVPEGGSTGLLLCALAALCGQRRGALRCQPRSHMPVRGAATLLLLVGLPAMAQTVGLPSPSPAAIQAGTAATVLVTSRLNGLQVVPGGVSVLKVASNGQSTVIGSLNDAGQDGDVLAGDGVYAGRVVLAESSEGSVDLRLSVAVRGSLRRLQSALASVAVVPAGSPVSLPAPDLSQRTVDPASGAQILANALTVCFNDGTPYATVVSTSALVGGTPAGRYSAVGNCYRLKMPTSTGSALQAAVGTLNSRPEVKFAEPEAIVRGADVCQGPICTDVNYSKVLNLPQGHNLGLGAGIVVGVLDTGVDAGLIPSISFPTAVLGSNFSTSGPAGIPKDDNGHGTLVAYIAQSTAPSSTLFIAKVLDANKDGSEGTTYNGIEEAKANGAKIINLSLSSKLQSFLMKTYLTQVQQAGLIIVAAAGNDGSTIQEYPAAHLGVVAVGNVDSSDFKWTGAGPSNFGPWVNIAAPGVNVAGLGTGTSYSAPFVSGALALMAAKFPSLPREALIARLYDAALPIPAIAGQDQCPAQPCNQNLGKGRLDIEAALGAIRITRSTAVGASGAAIVRTITVSVRSVPGNVLHLDTQRSFLGQSTGCEVPTVKDPPCISNVPFDFAGLSVGSYELTLKFSDPTASFFGSVQLNAPGAAFTAVKSGTASIVSGNPTRADFSLFGFGVNSVVLSLSKT